MSVTGVSTSNFYQGGLQANWQEQGEVQRLEQAFQENGTTAAPATDPTPAPTQSSASGSSDNSLSAALGNLEQAIQTFVQSLQQDFSAGQSTSPPATAGSTDQQPAAAPAATAVAGSTSQSTTGPAGQQPTPVADPTTAGQPAPPVLASPLVAGGQNTAQGNPIVSAFNALGQALQSGNLSDAQQSFTTLVNDLQPPQTSEQQQNSQILQAFSALGQALQSGSMSDAQQAFSSLQQDLQQGSGAVGFGHGQHHHGHRSSGSNNGSIGQAFGSLGQALQSGNMSAAQNAYTALQQDLEPSSPAAPAASGGTSAPVSVTITFSA
ncbi:MAG: hypothetical protein ACRD04_09260 [Terriglobales bacterium]